MATNRYITLQDSELSVVKRFKSIGLRTPWQRTDNFRVTLGGDIDKVAGTILYAYQYVLRVPAEVDDLNYGTLDDLKSLFVLNNPNGTPNDIITLIDHYGDSHTVLFNEDVTPEPLTTMLEGYNAWFIVPISFVEIFLAGGSGS